MSRAAAGPDGGRHRLILHPDPARVVLRPFTPADNPFPSDDVPRSRTALVVDRVLALAEHDVRHELSELRRRLDGRHADVGLLLMRRFHKAVPPESRPDRITPDQIRLIGAYLMEEYAVEAAALFNPSIVAHPNQAGTAPTSWPLPTGR